MAANVFSIPSTRARPATITIFANDTTEANDADSNTSNQPSPKKRPRIVIVEAPESIAHLYLPTSIVASVLCRSCLNCTLMQRTR
jgi:hypothetical protein